MVWWIMAGIFVLVFLPTLLGDRTGGAADSDAHQASNEGGSSGGDGASGSGDCDGGGD